MLNGVHARIDTTGTACTRRDVLLYVEVYNVFKFHKYVHAYECTLDVQVR